MAQMFGLCSNPTMSLRLWGVSLVLNAILAATVQWSAPAQPKLSDRLDYEWVGQHVLEPGCTVAVYCYRILVPVLLEQVPLEPETRWRAARWTATTLAGAIVAVTTAGLANGLPSAIIASLLVQGSYGFAFTAYDPYTADPWVFVILAVTAWCWLANRWLAAFMVTLIGIFAKETVALISVSAALAALVSPRRNGWRYWLVQAVVVSVTLLTYRWLADTYLGWDISQNAAAKFSSGSWLRIWWNNNPGLPLKAFFLFAPFGFGWLFAAAGVLRAPRDLQKLAIGATLPFLALNYVQTPERALGNLFFAKRRRRAILSFSNSISSGGPDSLVRGDAPR